MTALTRDTDRLMRDGAQILLGLKAGVTIRAGALVRHDGAYVNNLTPNENDQIAGVALQGAANTATGAADGDVSIRIARRRAFYFAAVAGSVPAAGARAFADDNNTVTSAAAGHPVIGLVIDADDDGVWVEHVPGIGRT